jgi:hypothetical protein
MAGMGPAPAETKRRRNKERVTELPADGNKVKAPRLPRRYRTGDGELAYLKATRDWYAEWARSPMAVQFTGVDWQRLQRVARVVDQYERDPDAKLLAEIRLQEADFGGSPLDRRRLGVTITHAPDAQPPPGARRAGPRQSGRRARLSVVT